MGFFLLFFLFNLMLVFCYARRVQFFSSLPRLLHSFIHIDVTSEESTMSVKVSKLNFQMNLGRKKMEKSHAGKECRR